MARRFIVEETNICNINANENIVEIKGKEVKHIQVLRHKVGDKIVINQFICEILEMKKNSLIVEKLNIAKSQGEPNIRVKLYMAILKGDKNDFVIQKATELGAVEILPFLSKNTVVKLDEKSKEKKLKKFQIVADEGAKQCGRTDMLHISNIDILDNILSNINTKELVIFAYENEKCELREKIAQIKSTNKNINNISIMIGPEGGFDKLEVDKLRKIKNVIPVSLGTRILRAETAAINLLSIIIYEFDSIEKGEKND